MSLETLIRDELRHNFNPIPPPNSKAPLSAEDFGKIKLQERYQQKWLTGFTMTELLGFRNMWKMRYIRRCYNLIAYLAS